ncbi:fungal-specific transcription factor domain-domain-containing protein [Naematelia encephala]|uniref:Fungal-specific transcription factor domain-domain-containing protein n=1 Tax=Naematelia encephala TaxID=71784 RepID=A0A1Y2B1R7_9TREE|nr:fungal-specific transcription factor domain-domain-containing protein [Naematelia encephala]
MPPVRIAAKAETDGSSHGATIHEFTDKLSAGEKTRAQRKSYSCSECRRLKLKCSRIWPCSSCEKRGCASICPDGETRRGTGKRLIVANTEELHRKIFDLEIQLAQIRHGRLPSPRIPPLSRSGQAQASSSGPSSVDEDNVVDGAYGTLTLGAEGGARYVGSFAGSAYLRDQDEEAGGLGIKSVLGSGRKESSSQGDDFNGPGHGSGLNSGPWSFRLPMAEVTVDQDLGQLEALRSRLPVWESEGRPLVQAYWDNVNWIHQPIPRPMFENDHLLEAYDTETTPHPHKLACAFLVMALGMMFDVSRPPFHPRAKELYLLGRACLERVDYGQATIATVQALHLCGTFILNDNRSDGTETFWPLLGIAIKAAQSLGLHRDGEAFGLTGYQVEERRQVYWELLSHDRLQALSFGRPVGTSNKHCDTKFPEPDGQLLDDAAGYHRAKHRLMHMLEKMIDLQTQTSPVSYNAVVQVDSELEKFKKALPEALLPNVAVLDLPLDRMLHPHLVLQRFGIRLLVAQTRLHVNRPAFASALRSNPRAPSQSKYSRSFMALYESAQEIIHVVKQLVLYHPSLVARWWFFWFHAFSSAVCLAAVAIRASSCAYASPSFHGLSTICDLSTAARAGSRARNGLSTLRKLRERAQIALASAASSSASQPDLKRKITDPPIPNGGDGDGHGDGDEEDPLGPFMSVSQLRRVPPTKRGSGLSNSGSSTLSPKDTFKSGVISPVSTVAPSNGTSPGNVVYFRPDRPQQSTTTLESILPTTTTTATATASTQLSTPETLYQPTIQRLPEQQDVSNLASWMSFPTGTFRDDNASTWPQTGPSTGGEAGADSFGPVDVDAFLNEYGGDDWASFFQV